MKVQKVVQKWCRNGSRRAKYQMGGTSMDKVEPPTLSTALAELLDKNQLLWVLFFSELGLARNPDVAPTGSRLYRGLAARFPFLRRWPIANRRYSRLPVGATWLSFLIIRIAVMFIGYYKNP